MHEAILWRQRDEDWLKRFHWRSVAADHHAVTVLQTPHAARGSGVNEVDAVTSELLVSANGVVEVRVAAINDGVALGEEGNQLVDHRLGGITARHHDPDALRGGQAVDQLLHGVGRLGALLGDLIGLLAGAVPNRHVVAVADQSLHHVGAHLAEADKSDLHDLPLHYWCSCIPMLANCEHPFDERRKAREPSVWIVAQVHPQHGEPVVGE